MTSPNGLFSPPRSLVAAFRQAYPNYLPDVFVYAPGRANLLGGHVDTHDGMVITIAINRGIWLAAAYGSTDLIRLYAPDLNESTTVSLKRLDDRVDVVGSEFPPWAWYPVGIAWAFQHRGLKVEGINAAFLGDIVMRAGLSSSAAIEMAFAVAWQALESWRLDTVELARVGQDAERKYLGLETGIQDQFTSLHARSGHALWLDCRSLEFQCLVLPASIRVVVCDTCTRCELASSGYNERAADCYAAAHTIGLINRQVKALRDVTLDQLDYFQALLTDSQLCRSRHVITEIARVQQGADALKRGDMAAFGALMDESYWSAHDDYGSSSPALDAMWQSAHRHPGCYGARYSGGGEGGVIVALVDAGAVDDFIITTQTCYRQTTGQEGNLFVVEPVSGAGVLF